MADKDFRLDSLASIWGEFEKRHTCGNNDDKWCGEFKDTLKTLARGADTFKLRGLLVARLVPGQLNRSLLAKEQPEIVDQYTVLVTKREFNQKGFADDLPELFEKYRAQRLVLASEKPSEQDTE